MSTRLGVIAALPFEAACFSITPVRPGTYQIVAPDVYVFCAGMGAHNASHAAQTLIAADVDALVSWGVAGALDPRLVSGDTVLPVQVRDGERHVYTTDHAWHAALKSRLEQLRLFAGGTILSVQDVQHDLRSKSDLHQATQALAVDMESAAVGRVAQNENKPFVVVRTIFDSASMRIPASSTNATDQYGQVSIPKLITGLARKPAEVLQYPQMIASFARAKKSLRRVAELCGHDLCFPPKS
ncbi:MAG: hypothetical protein WBO93_07700 [Gammaproteobacteria bacterium]